MEYLRIRQAAAYLGISAKTLRRWEKSGKLVSNRSPGGQRFYTPAQLEQFKKFKTNTALTPKRRLWPLAFAGSTLAVIFIGDLLLRPQTTIPTADPFRVLGTTDTTYTFSVNVPAQFNAVTSFNQDITAPNLVYSLTAGKGITVSDSQTPTITNTGVLSLNDLTGDLDLTAGGGISLSGLEISNADKGSSQNIFKTIAVSGQSDVVSDSNTDTLTFAAGTGLTITTDAGSDKISFSADGTVLNTSGWTDGGTSVYLSALTDLVGIGTADPGYNLEVAGTHHVSGASTYGSLQVNGTTAISDSLVINGNTIIGSDGTDTITVNGRLATGTGIYPVADLGANLGTADLRFNNVYVANFNSNSGLTSAGQATFTYSPADTSFGEATVAINPTSPLANSWLLGIGVNDTQKAGIDAEGDLVLTHGTASDNPLSTGNLTISTAGALTTAGSLDINGTSSQIAGTLNLSGNALTSTGDLTITPASTLNIAGTLAVNTNILYANSNYVGIGTTAPSTLLDIASSSGVDGLVLTSSGTKKVALAYTGNTASLAINSSDPTNNLTNGTFETDLSSWNTTQQYSLNDEFTTDRAAGAVNGTSAEPTGGTRTVVDTESKLSISSSQLSFAGGKASPATGNPGVWYPAFTRGAGKILLGSITPNNITSQFMTGFDTDQSGNVSENAFWLTSSSIRRYEGSSGYDLGSYSASTLYNTALVLRSTGAYFYIKGGIYTNWTLLWISAIGSTSTIYPGIANYDSVFTADNIRIPTALWLPTPLAYDTFTRADGAIGSSETTGPDSQTTPSLAWTGGAISSNKVVITPTLVPFTVINNDYEAPYSGSGTLSIADTWSNYGLDNGVDTAVEETTIVHSGSSSQKIIADAVNEGVYKSLPSFTNGKWYSFSSWVYSTQGRFSMWTADSRFSPAISVNQPTTYNSWVELFQTSRSVSASAERLFLTSANIAPPYTGYIDSLNINELTLSSLFSTVSTSDADVIADANVTLTAGTQAGLVLNLDSTSSPANFIIVYHDGTSVKVDEAVAGVYTNKQTTTVTYSAGATLRAIREGTKLRVYYNNALVGAELTMTANTNTIHGLFSTYSGNSFDNFTLWPRGSGTTKFTDAPFEELTATRDTGTKYAGSASAKLVAGGTDGTYLQSVNVGDTSTYTLIAYAYTTGAAVTSADLELYYDTSTISTIYSSVGGGGWYKLSGTLTGADADKLFGVRVKAGKTVYLDNITLTDGTGNTTTAYITNNDAGLASLDVQSTTTLNSGTAAGQGLIVKGAESQTGNLSEWQTSTASAVLSVMANGLVDGSKNGLATMSKAGTVADADFSDTPPNGTMAVDSTNGRLYFKYDSDWHYVAETAGFQIPKEETQGLEIGDYLIPYVERIMADGAVHGLYTRLDDALESLTDNQSTPSAVLTADSLNLGGMNLISNILEFSGNLSIQPQALNPIILANGSIEIDQKGNLNIKTGQIKGNANFRGQATLAPNSTSITVPVSWLTLPETILVNPDFNTHAWVEEITLNSFTIHSSETSSQNQQIEWVSFW